MNPIHAAYMVWQLSYTTGRHVAMFCSYTIVRDQILDHCVKNATYLISPVPKQGSLIQP